MKTENSSATEKKVIWALIGACIGALLVSILSVVFDRNEPFVYAEDVRAGTFVEVLLPTSVSEDVNFHDARNTASHVLQRFVTKGGGHYDVVLAGDVQYVLDNGNVMTFFDEAYVTWLLRKDLLTIVIRTEEFQNMPQDNRYRVFVRIPERGFTQEFHQALKSILKNIGRSTIRTEENWSI